MGPIGDLVTTYFNRDIEQTFLKLSNSDFERKTKPSLLLATNVGNMYTPSLYASLVSYLCQEQDLPGKRVALFSYGSGLASSFFSLQIKSGSGLEKLLEGLKDVKTRLESRKKVSAKEQTPKSVKSVLTKKKSFVTFV